MPRPSKPPDERCPAPNSVIQVDAGTGEILAVAEGMPSAGLQLPQVELGEGGVWVLGGGTVVHVDPSTAEQIAALTVGCGVRSLWTISPSGRGRSGWAPHQASCGSTLPPITMLRLRAPRGCPG